MSDRLQHHEYGDLIFSEHWRLQNIKIEHTFGEQQMRKGWGTYIDKVTGNEIKVPETIDSSKTPFGPLILFIPPKYLGTHENTIGDPNNPKWVPPGRKESGFAEIDFSIGWKGSPIAVAAFAICRGNIILDRSIYNSLYNVLSKNGGLGILDTLEYGDLGILDGHHRVKMAEESLNLSLKYVPVQLIPYLFDPSVVLDTWHNDSNVWKGEQVFECFKIPDKFADAKRTKFGVRGTDGIVRRILDTQPNITIPLENLI